MEAELLQPDGCTDRQRDGQRNGQTDGQKDRQMDIHETQSRFLQFCERA